MRRLIARGLRKAASLVSPGSGQIDITDAYVRWLCFANAGMLDRGNLYLIDYAVSRISSHSPMLEIGSFCGLSANLITYYKRKHQKNNRLFTCDKWEFERNPADVYVGDSPVTFAQYKLLVRDSYLRNIGAFSAHDLPFTIEHFSAEFFQLWRRNLSTSDVLGRNVVLGGPLSFCYVDGNHSYEGVKQDFENCDEFLEPGGFILFDDAVARDFGVWRLMPEVSATGRYKLVARNPNYLFQKISR